MPSPAHENAISRLRERPDLLAKLVEKLRSAQIDPHLNPIDSTQRFANPAEVTPDLVFLGHGPRWAIVEVQNSVDQDKRRRWLLAASMLFNDHREIGDVIIITASRRVARWAAKVASAQSALGTSLSLRPIVLLLAGDAIEALLDPEQPELGFFAAWAMQKRRGPEAKVTVERAIRLTDKLPEPLRAEHARAILSVLNREMATFFREKMMELSKDPMTPWAREVLAKFEASGEARGKAEGKAEGKVEGKVEGKREDLLAVLSARELPVSSAQKQRIQECADLDILERWIRRAATASSAQEALEESARSPRNGTAKQDRPAAPRRRTSR